MDKLAVIGMQLGDEGKGKIVDILSEKADVIARFQGGANAGHTVIHGDKQYIFHLIPSGVLKGKTCVIGNDVVVDLEQLVLEIEDLLKKNIEVKNNLYLSKHATIITDYHKTIDSVQEELKRKEKGKEAMIGSTKRGIAIAYADKYARTAIKIADLYQDNFREKLKENLEEKNKILTLVYNQEPIDFERLYAQLKEYAKRIEENCKIIDASDFMIKAIRENKRCLFEGAQGTHLDVDLGPYPMVTSSHPIAAGIFTGLMLPPMEIEVLGIAKAYVTRVGGGPFPSRMEEELENKIREKGKEYGATTGRPRKCGWFDVPTIKKSVMVNGASSIALNKLDVLSCLDEIKICIAYEDIKDYPEDTPVYIALKGWKEDYPTDIETLNKCKPVYITLEGWKEDISETKKYKDLPKKTKDFITTIENLCEIECGILSVGPRDDQTIMLKKYL